jgi:hypothetical protein
MKSVLAIAIITCGVLVGFGTPVFHHAQAEVNAEHVFPKGTITLRGAELDGKPGTAYILLSGETMFLARGTDKPVYIKKITTSDHINEALR